jgi:hypothetical protein
MQVKRVDRTLRWALVALAGALVADLVEDVVDPVNGENAAAFYQAAVHHHGAMVVSAVFLLVSSALVVPGVFGVARAVEGRGQRVAKVAAGLALLGAMGHAALAALTLAIGEMPGGHATAAQLTATIHRILDGSSLAIVFPLAIAFPLAIVVLLISTVRARIVSRWALVPILAAPIVGNSAIGSDATATAIALVLMLGTTAVLAARLLRAERPERGAPASAVAAA